MDERQQLGQTASPQGLILRRAKARLLRDLDASARPRTQPNFAPAEIWERDPSFNLFDGGRPKVIVSRSVVGTATASEVQTLAITNPPTSGTFTLTFGAATPVTVAFNASAATIQTQLRSLSTIGTGNILCTGGPINEASVVCTFAGTLANSAQSLILSVSSLSPSEIYPITGLTTGANGHLTIASTDATLFRKHDRIVIVDSSGVSAAGDAINNGPAICLSDATIASGVLTIYTNRVLQTAADLGNVIRLTPPAQLRGRVIQVVNRWSDVTLEEGTIVSVEQEDGSDWWDINAASCGAYEEDL